MAVELGNSAKLVVSYAEKERAELGHHHLGIEHLFLGVVALDDVSLHRRLSSAGVDLGEVARRVRDAAGRDDAALQVDAGMTPRAIRVMAEAERLALQMRPAGNTDDDVWAPHILLAIVAEERGLPARILSSLGHPPDTVAHVVSDLIAGYEWTESAYRGRTPVEQPELASSSDLMETLGRDLTALARAGKLHPIIGRQMETLQLISVLCKSEKNNPILVGEPGVGKTAVVEGLAQLVARGTVPPQLLEKRIRTVEVANIVAGTGIRGTLEEKLQALIAEARDDPSLILFIDEIHMLVGAGATGINDTMDAASILKPALSRGEITVIGATTEDEYRKYFEKDPALERRFAVVRVPEPRPDDVLEILVGLRGRYEQFHNVRIDDAALRAAVQLSMRYVLDRRLPDKALELIDRACAETRMREWLGLGDLDLSDLEPEARRALFERTAGGPGETLPVGADQVALAVSSWRRIPVGRVKETEAERLLTMEDALRRRVVGQDHAVAAVAQAIRTSRTAFGDPMRPIGCFLFLGPTGVGKTELARSLAEVLFDDEDRLIRVDMSESSGEHFVSRLIGSPPGYVNSEMGGMLTEAIRRSPYSVVLLDEVEKAAPAVHSLLLGLMDEGRLTDGLGRQADFRNAVIVMTSNVGSRAISAYHPFGFSVKRKDETPSNEEVLRAVEDDLRRTFAPEFRNRLDEILVFNALGAKELSGIARLMLSRLPMQVTASPGALKLLVGHGADPALGARPLRRAIDDLVREPLANQLLRHTLQDDDAVRLTSRGGQLVFTRVAAPAARAEPLASVR